jgi:hypothetical protein
MTIQLILLVGTLITIIGLGIVVLIRRKRPRVNKETDYRALFNIGIIFFSSGLAISISTKMINPLLILGVIYFAMGLANKDKWTTQQK